MRVLVWQNYGQIRVYRAESPADFSTIFQRLKMETSSWGHEEEVAIEDLYQRMGTAKSQEACEKLFTKYGRRHIGFHETFEDFVFVTVVTS